MTVLNTYLLSLAELSFPNLSWTIMLIWGALDVVHPGCLLQIIQKKNPEFFIILFIHACWFLRYVIYGLFQHHFLLLRRYRKNSSPNARGRCEENQKALCSQSSKKNLKMFFLRKQFLAWPGCFQLNFLLPCLYRWSSVFFSFWSISLRGYLQII